MIEYQLRSASGRVVCVFDCAERAKNAKDERASRGVNTRLIKVTRTEEEIV